jgi:hypothetical protein
MAAFAAFFARLRRLPRRLIEAAIRRGQPGPIFNSPEWRQAVFRVRLQVGPISEAALRSGYRSGMAELPGGPVRATIADFAAARGAPRAVALVQAVDQTTRQTISALIRSASRSYTLNPSAATIDGLVKDIRPLIGLTPKQAAQLRPRWRKLRKGGASLAEIRASVRVSAAGMIDRRAVAIGERGIVEAVGFARHAAWVEARDAGEIPESVMKAWADVADDAVRPSHRAQTKIGPIPLDAVYELHGVLHPPSPDWGCRCFERLIILNED